MAPSRAYIPSAALIRALSRPQPLRCPFARPIAPLFIRGKRTKAVAKAEKLTRQPPDAKLLEKVGTNAFAKLADDEWCEENSKPLSDKELEADDIPVISWYELDLDKGTPRRLMRRLATAEDRKKDRDMYLMIEESYKNPDYDDTELNRRLIDSLIQNPNFADLTQELKDIKADIHTKEEREAMVDNAAKEAEQENKEFATDLRTATRSAFEGLINDPDAAAAKEELQEVLDKMPEMEDWDSPEFQAVVNKAITKLNDDPRWEKKMEAMKDESDDPMKEYGDIERQVEEAMKEPEDDVLDEHDLDPETLRDLDPLLLQMRDILKGMGSGSGLEAEMDAILAEDPMAKQDGDFEREMDAEELADELLTLAKAKAPQARDAKDDENVPAELQAKVDKIMQDPRLMEKLAYIQKIIDETERTKSDITAIAHEVAPDPYELEDSRTATLKQRMQAARENSEHSAALDRLRVNLLPPFNISPALKSFNQAIELAYIGANDDIRRILWRSYQKARTLPTFLQNMSDEAWDILYYSQAVTWGSNQNRQSHLRTILADLRNLGRDGPPTHPSSLARSDHGEHLQV
jgi:hypothetical protein